jgi:hypothetical protein
MKVEKQKAEHLNKSEKENIMTNLGFLPLAGIRGEEMEIW